MERRETFRCATPIIASQDIPIAVHHRVLLLKHKLLPLVRQHQTKDIGLDNICLGNAIHVVTFEFAAPNLPHHAELTEVQSHYLSDILARLCCHGQIAYLGIITNVEQSMERRIVVVGPPKDTYRFPGIESGMHCIKLVISVDTREPISGLIGWIQPHPQEIDSCKFLYQPHLRLSVPLILSHRDENCLDSVYVPFVPRLPGRNMSVDFQCLVLVDNAHEYYGKKMDIHSIKNMLTICNEDCPSRQSVRECWP